METSENRIIFAQRFPDARPSAILKKIEEQSQISSTAIKAPPIPFEELLKKFEEKYIYEPKPDVDRESVIFFSLAIEVCRKFEIDTEICKRSHEITVTMDLYCGWHDGAFKRPFGSGAFGPACLVPPCAFDPAPESPRPPAILISAPPDK